MHDSRSGGGGGGGAANYSGHLLDGLGLGSRGEDDDDWMKRAGIKI